MNEYKTHVKTVSSTIFTASLRMREIQVQKTVQPPMTTKFKKVMSMNILRRINAGSNKKEKQENDF